MRDREGVFSAVCRLQTRPGWNWVGLVSSFPGAGAGREETREGTGEEGKLNGGSGKVFSAVSDSRYDWGGMGLASFPRLQGEQGARETRKVQGRRGSGMRGREGVFPAV
jgi:hypothetical protein